MGRKCSWGWMERHPGKTDKHCCSVLLPAPTSLPQPKQKCNTAAWQGSWKCFIEAPNKSETAAQRGGEREFWVMQDLAAVERHEPPLGEMAGSSLWGSADLWSGAPCTQTSASLSFTADAFMHPISFESFYPRQLFVLTYTYLSLACRDESFVWMKPGAKLPPRAQQPLDPLQCNSRWKLWGKKTAEETPSNFSLAPPCPVRTEHVSFHCTSEYKGCSCP